MLFLLRHAVGSLVREIMLRNRIPERPSYLMHVVSMIKVNYLHGTHLPLQSLQHAACCSALVDPPIARMQSV